MKESQQFFTFIQESNAENLISRSIARLNAGQNEPLIPLTEVELTELFRKLLQEAANYSDEMLPTSTMLINEKVIPPTTISDARKALKKELAETIPSFTKNLDEGIKIYSSLDEYFLKSNEIAIDFLTDEIKKKETELLSSEEKMKQVVEDSNSFAYAASHDLQEPLRMITSYLQLLSNKYGEKLDSEAREFISFAVDGSGRMRDLINGLLQYSRLNRTPEFKPLKLDEVLSAAIKNLEEEIVRTNTTIERDPLPEMTGDYDLLTQLFQQLITNAIKFRSDEPPKIKISADIKENMLTVSIKDNGIGLEKKYSEKIFVIFQRLHSKKKYPGSGIGLALCKKIAEMHSGSIRVDSEPGKGSVFHVTFNIK